MAVPKARVRQSRPEILSGKTYKIQPQETKDAWYVTINNGTIDEQERPIEIFINTKDVQVYQWIAALTRLMSAQLQQPGPFPKFVIEEMKDTYDLTGGYFIPGSQGKRANSIVAHIGIVMEQHCKELGLL